MDPHQSMMMRIIAPYLVRKGKGRGSNPIPNQIIVKEKRRRTYQKSSIFIIMGWDTLS